MKVIDVIFIGMLFMMTIALINHGDKFLAREMHELKSVCKPAKQIRSNEFGRKNEKK